MSAVACQNLIKLFGHPYAVRELNLDIADGEYFGQVRDRRDEGHGDAHEGIELGQDRVHRRRQHRFRTNLQQDLFTFTERREETIALMDIDAVRLADTEAVARQLAGAAGARLPAQAARWH